MSERKDWIDVTPRPLTRYATCMDREEVMRVLKAFESAGLEYVLIGAAALRERFGLQDEE